MGSEQYVASTLEVASEQFREFNRAAREALQKPRFSQSRRQWQRARSKAQREARAKMKELGIDLEASVVSAKLEKPQP